MGYKTIFDDPEYTKIITRIISIKNPTYEMLWTDLEYSGDSLLRKKVAWLLKYNLVVVENVLTTDIERSSGRPPQIIAVNWEGWARRIVSKLMKPKLEPAEYVSIGLVFEKFFKNSLRLRGKSDTIPSLNSIEDRFVSFVGLVTFKTGNEVEGLDAFVFSNACAVKLYLEIDSKCGGLSRQNMMLGHDFELKEL